MMQELSSVASVIVAVFALGIALKVEARNKRRFDEQLKIAQKIAEANLKPFLMLYDLAYKNKKGIRIVNNGQGAAVIKKLVVSNHNKSFKKEILIGKYDGDTMENNVARLFYFKPPPVWDNHWTFDQNNVCILPSKEMVLAELSFNGLTENGISKQDAVSILESWDKQVRQIEIEVEFEDVFGKKQPTCKF